MSFSPRQASRCQRRTPLLQQRTEGWAAGLRLAVLSLADHPDPEGFVAEFSGSDRTVAEYLLAEMLERQPDDVQRLSCAPACSIASMENWPT